MGVNVGWLVGFYGSAALYRLYIAPVSVVNVRMSARAGLVGFYGSAALYTLYIAPVSVVNVRMSARAGLVGSYHLAPSNSG